MAVRAETAPMEAVVPYTGVNDELSCVVGEVVAICGDIACHGHFISQVLPQLNLRYRE